jgi:hypothetical protein
MIVKVMIFNFSHNQIIGNKFFKSNFIPFRKQLNYKIVFLTRNQRNSAFFEKKLLQTN